MKGEGSSAVVITSCRHMGGTIWELPKVMGRTIGKEAIKLMRFYKTSI